MSRDLIRTLESVTTATLTTVLLKKGLRNVWVRGAKAAAPGGQRRAGRAFTLRFTPYREDLSGPAAWSSPRSTRAAVEAVPEGAVVVADAMGSTDAGVFGDILCQRLAARGVAALVTDGAMRDVAGCAATGLPLWHAGAAAPPAVAAMHFTGWGDVIGCGGVTIFPSDWIVADDDGAVVVPAALAEEVAAEAAAQEDLEEWIMAEVAAGQPLRGLYPPNEEALARYRKARS